MKDSQKSKTVHGPIQNDETLYLILAKAKYTSQDDRKADPTFIEEFKS